MCECDSIFLLQVISHIKNDAPIFTVTAMDMSVVLKAIVKVNKTVIELT